MNENWARWEKQVVNGVFPLRRSVRTSDHSAVFLTEHKTKAIADALLKLVPAIPTMKEAQLAHWSVASRLSHPCLVRLLDTGTCQLEGLQFLFVVTEYAEQTLAQILAQRPLAPDELRKLVRPVLDALSFLHRKKLVHGGLEPSNLLLFKERLKLASDAVRPVDESTASIAPPSVFDPPESRDGSYSAAGDVWSLGVLIVEALTQKRPVWPDKSGTAVLPEALPAAFVEIVRRCLSRPRDALHEELPDVPEKALATIHGRMLFAVRVTVDPEGRIFHAAAVGNRSSKYFARLCVEAAMRWKFAAADTIATRKWLLHFEFTRAGVVAHAN
jgi:serine/threonine protein kinase